MIKNKFKSCVTVSADIPKEWASILREKGNKQIPRMSRKAVITKIIEKEIKKESGK